MVDEATPWRGLIYDLWGWIFRVVLKDFFSFNLGSSWIGCIYSWITLKK